MGISAALKESGGTGQSCTTAQLHMTASTFSLMRSKLLGFVKQAPGERKLVNVYTFYEGTLQGATVLEPEQRATYEFNDCFDDLFGIGWGIVYLMSSNGLHSTKGKVELSVHGNVVLVHNICRNYVRCTVCYERTVLTQVEVGACLGDVVDKEGSEDYMVTNLLDKVNCLLLNPVAGVDTRQRITAQISAYNIRILLKLLERLGRSTSSSSWSRDDVVAVIVNHVQPVEPMSKRMKTENSKYLT